MKKVIKFVSVAFIGASLTGCIALQSVSVSGVTPSGGSAVTTSASGLGILALTIPSITELERKALDDAKSQGASKNFSARLSMRNWVIVQNYKVEVTGEK